MATIITRKLAVAAIAVMAVAATADWGARHTKGRASAASYERALLAWNSSENRVAINRPAFYDRNGSALAPDVGSKHYYVSLSGRDSNDGSLKRPLATITKAAKLATPGTTIHVLPGTYEGEILTKASGADGRRIVYISEQKWGAKLRTSKVGDTSVHWDNYGDYVDIVGFDLSGVHSYGIYNRGSYVRVINNHVHDYTQVACGKGGAGIEHGARNAKYSGHDNDTIGNTVHNIRPPVDCKQAHGVGIYHAVAGGHIYNNVVYNTGKSGIQMWHAATRVIVANNTVFDNRWSGILVGNEGMCCGSSTGVNDNTVVVNNIVFANGRDGIEEYGETGKHNVYAQNLAYGNKRMNVHLQNGLAALDTVTAHPGFVKYDPSSDGGDYRLRPKSPAIGKCTRLGAPLYDINGQPRFRSSNCSLGAYESTGN
ncbi:MAG TPA: right-handed parallel beta-helix repeat-containing protein [Terriglobales bacterium]|nr:right-handed parallel beta-helix repeat-containing protein [Terriglobales bacterium]